MYLFFQLISFKLAVFSPVSSVEFPGCSQVSPLSGFTAWHWTTQRNTSTWLGSLRVETPSTDGMVWTVGKLGEEFGHRGL